MLYNRNGGKNQVKIKNFNCCYSMALRWLDIFVINIFLGLYCWGIFELVSSVWRMKATAHPTFGRPVECWLIYRFLRGMLSTQRGRTYPFRFITSSTKTSNLLRPRLEDGSWAICEHREIFRPIKALLLTSHFFMFYHETGPIRKAIPLCGCRMRLQVRR